MARADLKLTQTRLQAAGYYTGSIDGKYGPKTDAAINQLMDDYIKEEEPDEEPDPAMHEYTRDVVYNEQSEEVRKLQEMLKLHGFGKYLGTAGIDGQFGTGTRKGVEEYVRGRGLNTPLIESSKYKTVTKEIWDMFHLKVYDIENSIFTEEYFKCRCSGLYCRGAYDSYGVSLGLVMLALRLDESVKAKYGASAVLKLTVSLGKNGGNRCAKQNAIAGGAENSQHIYSRAGDFYISGVSGADYNWLQQEACIINPYGGCSESYNSVAHMDTRGNKARW